MKRTLRAALKAWTPVLLLGCAVLAVEGLGYAAYRSQRASLARDSQERMTYLAQRNASRIDAWLRERLGDARATAGDPLLAARLRRGGRGRDLDQRLDSLRQAYHYESVRLLGPGGRLLAAAGDGPLEAWEEPGVARADGPRILWRVRNLPGRGPQLSLSCLAALPGGVLVFRMDPGVLLGDLGVAGWPTSSPSGETLLLAREGDEALFLNRTRRPGQPVLRVPLARRDLVGVQALLAGDGPHRGVDYLGVPTVAVSCRLQTLPWVVLVKQDQGEYLLPMRRLTWTYALLGAPFLAAAGGFLWAWLRRQRARLEGERRALARKLEFLGRYGNDIVLVLDQGGRLLEANDRAVEAYQMSREELCRLRVEDLRAPANRADYLEQFRQVQHDHAVRFRTLHRRRDGTPFPVEVSSMAFDLDGRTLVQSLIRDITAQQAYEDRIRALNDQLEQRVQERTAQLEAALRESEGFSHSIAHDLRGPLRGIDGFSHALLEDYGERLDDQGRHYLQRIRSGIQRMGRMMDELLDLARLSRQRLAPETVDLSAQARSILADLAEREPRQARVEVQDGLRIQADPGMMRVVLGQLLGNAWKFTGKCPEARIAFGAAAGPEGTAYFVRDNGVGFDMAYAGKLFGAFQRLHDPAEYTGTGVGLAIVQRILQRHGGRIWAEAAPGRGATFFFNLPQ